MRHRNIGKITDSLWYLGNEDVCVYLLEGDGGSTLINGGIGCLVPDLLDQFARFGIDESRINKFVILHAHFDHIGIVPYFKRRFPDLTVYASASGLKVLKNPKALATMNRLDAAATAQRGMAAACQGYDLEWRESIEGVAVGDGDRIELGNTRIEIIELPGHSACSIAAYVPEIGALFPSDGGGIPFDDTILTYGTWNYDTFVASLHKLEGLAVKYLCADHCGYVSGEEAARFVTDAIKVAEANRAQMVAILERTGSIDAAAGELYASLAHQDFGDLLPRETKLQTYRLMLQSIAGGPR